MAEPSRLQALLARGRGAPTQRERGEAYVELSRLLMMLVRASMSRRLRSGRDSMDVCQSVVRSFVADFQAERIAFESEAALVAYLRRIVRNKLADLSRHDAADKRGRGVALVTPAAEPVAGDAGPATAALSAEAVERALASFGEEERRLWALRRRGWPWARIAAELGIPEAVARKRWSRLCAAAAEADLA